MKIPLVVSIVALAVGVLALTVQLVGSSRSGRRESHSAVAAAPSAVVELESRLEALAAENRALLERVTLLEMRPDPEQRVPAVEDFASRDELAALRDELLAARSSSEGGFAATSVAPGGAPPQEFAEQVSQAMEEIRVEEARESARRKTESRAERLRERLPQIGEKLYLTPGQEDALESALLAHYERQSSYAVMWATGEVEDKSDFGPIIANDNQMFADELASFLTPQQLEDYESLNDSLFPGLEAPQGKGN
jgi:hypothetical protein